MKSAAETTPWLSIWTIEPASPSALDVKQPIVTMPMCATEL